VPKQPQPNFLFLGPKIIALVNKYIIDYFVVLSQEFSVETWSHRTRFFGKSGPPLVWVVQIGKTASDTFNTCKEAFSLCYCSAFPHTLAPVWNLSLTSWEVLS